MSSSKDLYPKREMLTQDVKEKSKTKRNFYECPGLLQFSFVLETQDDKISSADLPEGEFNPQSLPRCALPGLFCFSVF
jgi:hypothetical protein